MEQQLNDYYQVNEVLDIVKCDLQYHMENETDLDELHHELFNTDYFVDNESDADKFADQHWFEILGHVMQYEQDQFGEITSDITNKSQIINMYVYIVGEEILQRYHDVFKTIWHLWAIDEKLKAKRLIDVFVKYEEFHKSLNNALEIGVGEMGVHLRVELDLISKEINLD